MSDTGFCFNCNKPLNECTCKREERIRVEIDNSKQLEALREEYRQQIENLKSENETLKEDLNLIAQKEFKAKCEKYGLNPETTSIEELKTTIESSIPKPPSGGETARFDQSQIEGKTIQPKEEIDKNLRDKYPLDYMEFDSYEDAISTLNRIAGDANNQNQKEAQAKLNELIQKHKEAGSKEFELDTPIKDITRGIKGKMRRIR
jgi:chromosome segregation ATPase